MFNMMAKLFLLLPLLTACNAYIGAGVHPQSDTWGSEYNPLVGVVRIQQRVADNMSVEYEHVSSLPDKDQPGLNMVNVLYKIK